MKRTPFIAAAACILLCSCGTNSPKSDELLPEAFSVTAEITDCGYSCTADMTRSSEGWDIVMTGPETVEGILIDADGIYVGDSEELFYPLIEVFKSREEAEELIKLLGIDKLPFAENDAVNSPKGDDTIAALSIDYDRRKLIIHTDKGYNFTLEEWGESVTPR